MMMSLTSESTILPKAAPMITPTARSTTLPFIANFLNSVPNDMSAPPSWRAPRAQRSRAARRWTLDGRLPALARADADDLLDRRDEDLAVADLAGARRLDDRLDRALGERVLQDHLDLDLRQEIDDVLGAAVELGVALLAAEALDLGHGEPGDAELRQRLAHLVELERLDDRFDLLHGSDGASPPVTMPGDFTPTSSPAPCHLGACAIPPTPT